MNYAWSHPETGVREQDDSAENARRRVWEELQAPKISPSKALAVPVYEQEPIGWVSQSNKWHDIPEAWDSYAWTDPNNGRRHSDPFWCEVVKSIQETWPENSPVEKVIVYRQRLAFWAKATDPEPAPPAPPAAPDDDSPASLIEQVIHGNCADLNRASLLAQLWMAQSLMEIAGYVHRREARRAASDARYESYRLENESRRRNPELRPHVFQMPPVDPSTPVCLCLKCGYPEKHAIHGYTGE
jgi:hypothetical protein